MSPSFLFSNKLSSIEMRSKRLRIADVESFMEMKKVKTKWQNRFEDLYERKSESESKSDIVLIASLKM